MSRIIQWLGVSAVVALSMAFGGWSQPTAAQSPAPAGSQPTRFVGSDLFQNYCVTCHGKSGRGDGVLADMLKKRPPDLTQFARTNGGVFPSELVRKIIDGRQPVTGHGGKDMPVWGDAFQSASGGSGETAVQERIEALVRHIESLQVKAAN